MLQIVYTPSWANGGKSEAWVPSNPASFAAFATAAARHYPSVHLWKIWGEPTRQGLFEPLVAAKPYTRLDAAQQVAPHNYARLLDAAYGALKAVSKSNLVIGGSTYFVGLIDTQQWIENLRLPDGKPPRMDMYAHNPFSYEPPIFSPTASPLGVVQFSDLPRLAGWIDRYLGKGIPLFLSEFTEPTDPDQEFAWWLNPHVAAQWVTEAMKESRSWKRIYALGWIHLYDNPPESYGGLLTDTGVRKPDFEAFARG